MGPTLLEETAIKILDLKITPMVVAEHLSINSFGECIPKQRVTHGLSWPGIWSKESINSRMDWSKLEPILLGHCLSRLMHQIILLRRTYPGKKTWTRKDYIKSAYIRMHLRVRSALKSAAWIKMTRKCYIILSLSITFGRTSNPADFCLFLEIICYIINDMLTCRSWNEKLMCSFCKNIGDDKKMHTGTQRNKKLSWRLC